MGVRGACFAVVCVIGFAGGSVLGQADGAEMFRETAAALEPRPIHERLGLLTDAALRSVGETGWWSVAIGSGGGERVRFGVLSAGEVSAAIERAGLVRGVVEEALPVLSRAIDAALNAGVDRSLIDRAIVVVEEILPTVLADSESVSALLGEVGGDDGAEGFFAAPEGVTAGGRVRVFAGRAAEGAWRMPVEAVLREAQSAQRGYERLTVLERESLGAGAAGLGRAVELARAGAIARARGVDEAVAYLEQQGVDDAVQAFRVRAHVELRRSLAEREAGGDLLLRAERALVEALSRMLVEARVDEGVRSEVFVELGGRFAWALDRAGVRLDQVRVQGVRDALASFLLEMGDVEGARVLVEGGESEEAAVLRSWVSIEQADAGVVLIAMEVADAMRIASGADRALLGDAVLRRLDWQGSFTASEERDAFVAAGALAGLSDADGARVWATRAVSLGLGGAARLDEVVEVVSGASALEGGSRQTLVGALADAMTAAVMRGEMAVVGAEPMAVVELLEGMAGGESDGVVVAGAAVRLGVGVGVHAAMLSRVGEMSSGLSNEVYAWGLVGAGRVREISERFRTVTEPGMRGRLLRGVARGVGQVIVELEADASDVRGVGFGDAAGVEDADLLFAAGPAVAAGSLLSALEALSAGWLLVEAAHQTDDSERRDGYADVALRIAGSRIAHGEIDAVTEARFTLLASRAWHAMGDHEKAFASYRRLAVRADQDDALLGRDGAIAIRAWLGMIEVALSAEGGGSRREGLVRTYERLQLRTGWEQMRGTDPALRVAELLD